jgi:uncharacterized heparinase superfamily protein
MARVSVADRTGLSWLLVRRALRSLAARINAHPLVRWRFFPMSDDKAVIAPQDLRTADGTRANEIYSGRFAFAGKVVTCVGRSPFEMPPPSEEWAAALHGFGWLRHLRAAESGIARANGRALVEEWIALQRSWDLPAWSAEVLARRIISWLSQAPLVVYDRDPVFYRAFLRSLTRQVRYLRATSMNARDGVPRLQVTIALALATLCMERQQRYQRAAVRTLVRELERQVLRDGGHLGRNPGALIEILLDLLPLRQAFASRNVAPPQALNNAIDRMTPMLRFFRHGDGNLALFNGMGPTQADAIATVLAYDDARGAPLANAPYAGYQRCERGETLLIVDTGPPPPMLASQEAHAGCLAFEMSIGLQQVVVNCGMPALNRDTWRDVARATAAHSTVTFNDTSSCRFLEGKTFRRLMFGSVVIAGPNDVTVAREEVDAIALRASHDGYADRFGIVHERRLTLAADGSRLDGEDIFTRARGAHADAFAIRMHLHPAVKASRVGEGQGALLVLPNNDVWTFHSDQEKVELEESVYLGGSGGPRRTVQIVIAGDLNAVQSVQWTFARAPAANPAEPRPHAQQSELPL